MSVYGRRIDEKRISDYLDRELNNYRHGDDPKKLILHNPGRPFIAEVPLDIFAKYYVHGVGTIPRWSFSSKRIDKVVRNERKRLKKEAKDPLAP